MDRYEYLNREWIVSSKARKVYRTSAALSLMLFLLLMVLRFAGHVPFARELLFIAILCSVLTSAAMEYFLFRFDDSHALKQVLWFILMLFVPVGPSLYCLIVYSRSRLIAEEKVNERQSATG